MKAERMKEEGVIEEKAKEERVKEERVTVEQNKGGKTEDRRMKRMKGHCYCC